MGIFIYLADADAHFERARQAGAEIVQAPHDEPYGRTYTARDLDGTSLVLHHSAQLVRARECCCAQAEVRDGRDGHGHGACPPRDLSWKMSRLRGISARVPKIPLEPQE